MKVGFIGLGRMGTPIARNLAQYGFDLRIYNRTPSKVEEFLKSTRSTNVQVAKAPVDLADCELILMILTDARAVEQVLFSSASGLLSHSITSKKITIVDMSTIAPSESIRIASLVESKGARMLDAPVSGGPKSASEKQLVVFVGGQEETYKEISEIFELFSKRAYYVGRQGMGCFMKLITVVNLSSLMLGLSESLTLAEKVGISKDLVIDILNNTSSNRSGLSESKGPTMAKRNFSPSFTLNLMSKDLNLVNMTCHELNLQLKVSSTITELYNAAVREGYGDQDFSAIEAFEEKLAQC